MHHEYLAIYKQSLLAKGDIISVIRKVKAFNDTIEPYLFELSACKRVDIDWHGTEEEVISKLSDSLSPKEKKRGRPKLGVKSKEVTLLPEHWEWLSVQRGGASITLRRLIDNAMQNVSIQEKMRIKQNQIYNLMTPFSDDSGFEAASRALYRCDLAAFDEASHRWSTEVRDILIQKFHEMLALQEAESHD
ncbi:DUF2239 family protein [Alteromonas sp. a30]|uniref:DUF2239 family protein n=1 Tax=Alteromonas sp. a30 TaxID=2730917 RepID=UPI00227F5869|nr:DUF2239 family protein [Alteromonas sp. a30]MCY7296733.1 DUF2239 family protein [Alteromonas sp. a30]